MNASEITDACVIAAAEGCSESLRRVVQCVMVRAPRMIAGRLGPGFQNAEAYDEIGQRAAYALISRISRLENRTVRGLRGFFSGIITNKVREYIRTARTNGNGGLSRPKISVADAAVDDLLAASDTTPYTATERRDQILLLQKAMARLNEDEREVLCLAMFDQLGTSGIADKLEITRSAAYMRLTRAFERLRASFLDDSGIFDLDDPH